MFYPTCIVLCHDHDSYNDNICSKDDDDDNDKNKDTNEQRNIEKKKVMLIQTNKKM